jgi:hypothetical protein
VDYPAETSREYTRSWGLAGIKALKAWERGATGAGIRVGVVDTGIDREQPDLKNNISPLSRDMEIGRPNQTIAAEERHGTRVAGVIAHEFNGTGTVGVAFKSTILSYRADREGSCEETGDKKGCKLPESYIARGIDAAIADGAKVINLSLGSADGTGTLLQSALLRATQAGIIVVASAGNDATFNPEFPAQLAIDSRFNGLIIAAGSTDKAEALSSFSAKAGIAKNNFLVAPGTEIIADCGTTSCWQVSGTSFSAPHISGSLALLLQAFPSLNGSQAVDILYRTARDLGAPGADDVFGRGLIDLERAFSPLGATTSSSSAGQGVRIDLFEGVAGRAFGDAFIRDGLPIAVLDEYQRPFNVALGYRLAPNPTLGFGANTYELSPKQTAAMGEGMISLVTRMADSAAWGVKDGRALAGSGAMSGLYPLPSLPFGGQLALSFAQSDHQTSAVPYGLAGDPGGGGVRFGLLSLGQFQAYQGLVMKAGATSLHAFSAQGDQTAQRGIATSHQSASFVQLAHAGQSLTSVLELGVLSERGSFLGTRWGDGNLAFRPDATQSQNRFVGMQFDLSLNPDTLLTARVQGSALARLSSNAVFAQGQNLYASAASLVLSHHQGKGWWRASLEQPLRVETGSLHLLLADPYRSWDQPQTWSRRQIDVTPSGRELRFSVGRDWMLGTNQAGSTWLGVDLMQVHQPDHVAKAPDQTILQLRGSARF